MRSQLPVGLELFLVEELVQRALVGKLWMESAVTPDQLRFVSGNGKFYIQQQSNLRGSIFGQLWIKDATKYRVGLAEFCGAIWPEGIQFRFNANAKVDLRVAHQRHESLKREQRVRLAIDAHNIFAPAAKQLINRHIFDVAAVREIEPRSLFGHSESKHLLQKTPKTGRRALAGLGNPKSQPDVEYG